MAPCKQSIVVVRGAFPFRIRVANKLLLTLAVLILYALHQDVWFWRTARPLLFGFLPVGLAWHGAYCLAVSLLMWWLTRVAWPAHLEADGPAKAGRDR